MINVSLPGTFSAPSTAIIEKYSSSNMRPFDIHFRRETGAVEEVVEEEDEAMAVAVAEAAEVANRATPIGKKL